MKSKQSLGVLAWSIAILWSVVSWAQEMPSTTNSSDETDVVSAQEAVAASADAAPTVDVDSAVDDDDDDDWETDDGPVDRTPKVSGALQASFRSTFYSQDQLPDGTAVDDHRTFQIEHTHVKFSGDLTQGLSWEIMPCVTHMNNFSVITANISYSFDPKLQVTFGRFLLPFGQFNLRSLPGSYNTVSRPLIYQSHEDRMIRFGADTPGSFLFTPREDVGLLVNGNMWFDKIQVSYAGYLTNGLRATSDQTGRFWDDNNNGKQIGGRLGASYNADDFTVSLGGSALVNKYEDDPNKNEGLDQLALAADVNLSYQMGAGRNIVIRGEYLSSQREIVPTDDIIQGDEGLTGAYVTAEVGIMENVQAYYQFDTVKQRTPVLQVNEGFRDRSVRMIRHSFGGSYTFDEFLVVRGEYGVWLTPSGVPDAHRISIQTVVTF